MRTTLAVVLVCGSICSAPLNAQASYFAGAFGGISTLSADGRSELAESRPRVSLYKPENGPTFMFFGGRHLNEYLSLQASYGWNRNELTLSATDFPDGAYQFYEQRRSAVQHSFAGEALLYFRNRRSFARPYLSAGGGIVHLSSGEGRIRSVAGSLPAPGGFSSTGPALRVAVGIDVFFGKGWAFRYSFGETIRRNAISRQLAPEGRRNLANFQNLFGFVKYF